jgi:hypothetical protein
VKADMYNESGCRGTVVSVDDLNSTALCGEAASPSVAYGYSYFFCYYSEPTWLPSPAPSIQPNQVVPRSFAYLDLNTYGNISCVGAYAQSIFPTDTCIPLTSAWHPEPRSLQYYITSVGPVVNITSVVHSNAACSSRGVASSQLYPQDNCMSLSNQGLEFDGKSSIEYKEGLNVKLVFPPCILSLKLCLT